MTENRLTSPVRRYEITEDNRAVKNELVSSFASQKTTVLNIRFADVYEGLPPIPEKILRRQIAIRVLRLYYSENNGNTYAIGREDDKENKKVSVNIPGDESKNATLHIIDTPQR